MQEIQPVQATICLAPAEMQILAMQIQEMPIQVIILLIPVEMQTPVITRQEQAVMPILEADAKTHREILQKTLQEMPTPETQVVLTEAASEI
jgi:hypothetical protein